MHIRLTHGVSGATTGSSCCTTARDIAEAEAQAEDLRSDTAARRCLEPPLGKINPLGRCAARSAKRHSLRPATRTRQTPPAVRLAVNRPMPTQLPCSDPEDRTTGTSPVAASEADRTLQLRAAIATRLERGDSLDTVERELIAPSRLPEEQQSALWVYAWSHPKRSQEASSALRNLRSHAVRPSR